MNEQDLRDCFAMFAMNGLLQIEGEHDNQVVSEMSYAIADAMLIARNQVIEVTEEDGIVAIKKRVRKK